MPADPSIDDLLQKARVRLAAAPFAPSTREAALLLGHVLGLGEAQVLARGDRPVAPAERQRFLELLERRLGGEPVAYLFGEREFYGRSFAVDRRVLIPRPETELLVAAALAADLPAAPRILDLGTGSGCLAVTLALELPAARVVASDRSPGALAVAAGNVRRWEVGDRVRPVAADLFAGLDVSSFDLVVSNPPYVDPDDAPGLSPEVVDFEPPVALFAGDRGEAVIARILSGAADLRRGALLLLEIGAGQLPRLERRLAASASASALQSVGSWNDYSGIPRVLKLVRRP
ncbi:MAG TPA: peptide chain release factor N(5)-glutamine methyltransferase [Thermoanaerobaculia bacterium]|nr:peptide chain release factor N(5)-glutamine methyltransferase [Thermoanaerobaculia bacterium]